MLPLNYFGITMYQKLLLSFFLLFSTGFFRCQSLMFNGLLRYFEVLVRLPILMTFDSQLCKFKNCRHADLKFLFQFVSSCSAGLVMVQNSKSNFSLFNWEWLPKQTTLCNLPSLLGLVSIVWTEMRIEFWEFINLKIQKNRVRSKVVGGFCLSLWLGNLTVLKLSVVLKEQQMHLLLMLFLTSRKVSENGFVVVLMKFQGLSCSSVYILLNNPFFWV